eukprot:SAG31_NODE_1281_length_9019_cov_4.758072_4_plen_199_part_00
MTLSEVCANICCKWTNGSALIGSSLLIVSRLNMHGHMRMGVPISSTMLGAFSVTVLIQSVVADGYNLGQFRVDSDKTMVYDHVTRVPFLIKGPGIAPGQVLTHVASMADVSPTLLELVAGTAGSASVRADMDGHSWAALLLEQNRTNGATVASSTYPRTAALIEYHSRGGNRCSGMHVGSAPGTTPSIGIRQILIYEI